MIQTYLQTVIKVAKLSGKIPEFDRLELLHLLFRKDKVVSELLRTEQKYVDDLGSILAGYRDRMRAASTSMGHKAEDIFGNMENVFAFHSESLLPELERCGEDGQMIAKTFMDSSKEMERIYTR